MKKQKGDLFFLIMAIIEIALSIFSIATVDETKKALFEAINKMPEYMQERMISTYNHDAIFIIPSIFCIILGCIILVLYFNKKLDKKRNVVLTVSILSFLFGDNLIINLLAIVGIIVACSFEPVKKEKKTIPILNRIDYGSKYIIGACLALLFYFSVRFIPIGSNIYINIFISLIKYISILIITVLVFKDNLKRDFKFFKDNFSSYIHYIAPRLGIMYIIYFVLSLICTIITKQNTSVNQETLLTLPIYVLFPLAVFWAPIVEELLFRGCIRRFIKNDILFIILSGLIFGLLHTINEATIVSMFVMMLPYALLGSFFAYLYVKTNNILNNILCHSFHNFIAMVLLILLSL